MIRSLLITCLACGFTLADSFEWTTFAGSNFGVGKNDGPLAEARIHSPADCVVDAAGYIFFLDSGNHTIRKISPDGIVTTIAGKPGTIGFADGPGQNARFYAPFGITLANNGDLLVADSQNHAIRRVKPDGFTTTLAGGPTKRGFADGPVTSAKMREPRGIATHGPNIIFADSYNHSVRKLDENGQITTLAGGPFQQGFLNGNAQQSRFRYPIDVAIDAEGNILVADPGNALIRKISNQGIVTTLAGQPGITGGEDGPALEATLTSPIGLAITPNGDLLIGDAASATIRRLDSDGQITTWLGKFQELAIIDGPPENARLVSASRMAFFPNGDMVFCDDNGNSIRRVSPDR